MEGTLRSHLLTMIADILAYLDDLDTLINDMKIDPLPLGITEKPILTARSIKADMLSNLAWAFRELEDIDECAEDLEELKAQLSYLIEAIDELAEAGYDVSDFNTWLEKARTLIQASKKEN